MRKPASRLKEIEIRPARVADLDEVSRLAAGLVRLHHGWDSDRFMMPDDPEGGYRWWFGKEIRNPRALILVAATRKIVGYAYARIEPRDWNALLDRCAWLHDILVAGAARRKGVARRLLAAVGDWARSKKAPRLVLCTSVKNLGAQKFFHRQGFRPTMIEMAFELPRTPGMG